MRGPARALLALTFAIPTVATAQGSGAPYAWATVTYRSGASIYLDAGTSAGVRERTTVEFVRGDSVLAVVEVQFVSSTRSSGTLLRGVSPTVGDSGRYLPVATAAVTGDSAGAPTPVRRSARGLARSTSARVGLRYMQLQNGTAAAGRLTQPALDLRLESHRLNDTPFGLVLDARAHSQRTGDGRSEANTRVYQANVELQSGGASPARLVLGRQLATALSPIGFFDGVTVDADHATWRVGALVGTQPDAISFSPGTDIREAGAWLQWHNAPQTVGLYQLTLGAVGSYTASGINREFGVINAVVVSPWFSLFATQEIDYNRDWRLQAEAGQAVTWSSTFATARVALGPALSLNGSYDTRRNVRVYHDFITPDVTFDDTFRRGYSGGVALSLPHFYLNADTRISEGGTTPGRNSSQTASMSLTQLTPLGVGLRARATAYDGPSVAGRLWSGSVEISPRGLFRLEGSVGRRQDSRNGTGYAASQTSWVGIDADFGIGRSWYVMFSHYRETGPNDRLLQQYAGLSWRY